MELTTLSCYVIFVEYFLFQQDIIKQVVQALQTKIQV